MAPNGTLNGEGQDGGKEEEESDKIASSPMIGAELISLWLRHITHSYGLCRDQ